MAWLRAWIPIRNRLLRLESTRVDKRKLTASNRDVLLIQIPGDAPEVSTFDIRPLKEFQVDRHATLLLGRP